MKKNMYFFMIIIAASMWAFDGVLLTPRYFIMNLFNSKIIIFLASFTPTLGILIFKPKIVKKILNTFHLKDYINLFILSLFGGTIGTLAIVKALSLVNFAQFSIVAIIQQLQPLAATIFAIILLNEKPKISFYVILIISLISVYLLQFGLRSPYDIKVVETLPVVYSLIAVVAFGLSTVLSRKMSLNYEYDIIVFLRFFFTTLVVFILIVISKDERVQLFNVLQTKSILLNALIIAIWGYLAMIVYYLGMVKTTALQATLGELSFPVVSVLLNILVYNTRFTIIQIISIIVLVVSIMYYNVTKSINIEVVEG